MGHAMGESVPMQCPTTFFLDFCIILSFIRAALKFGA